MTLTTLTLPARTTKPRTTGLTMVIDNGLPARFFADAITTAAPHIDIVKFGWGTALVTPCLAEKVAAAHDAGIRCSLGGTLFEKYVFGDRFDDYLELCRHLGVDLIEVSNGTIPMSNFAKTTYIRKCADVLPVFSEVGLKDTARSDQLSPEDWIDAIAEDLDAGSTKVITEARESGRSGLCHANGELRSDLFEAILESGIDSDQLLFEAPTKDLQATFIDRLGANVNLGNVAAADVLALETLRLGLRADTFMRFEGEGGA
jgi:phosphosulfolactate synthase